MRHSTACDPVDQSLESLHIDSTFIAEESVSPSL